MSQKETQGKTHWHRILGKLFELLFTATDVTVKVDFKLMSDPPRGDILLLRRNTPRWTAAQMARLPDGLRDILASHLLLEFKYTESLNPRRIEKAHGYDILYREIQGLTDDEVASFILSAKTPRSALLRRYGYQVSQWPGVYLSEQAMVNRVGILVLNELRPVPHNAYVKCFASRQKAKESAFAVLDQRGLEQQPKGFFSFVTGLRQLVLPPGDKKDMLNIEITPEDVMALGKEWQAALLADIPVEERLAGLKPEERLIGLKPEERLIGLKPEDVLSQYKPYLEEQERQVILRTILRTLQVRFSLAQETLDTLKPQLQPFDLGQLEQLSDLALTVENVTAFETELHHRHS